MVADELDTIQFPLPLLPLLTHAAAGGAACMHILYEKTVYTYEAELDSSSSRSLYKQH
jgi:hypothetical protein